MVSRTPSELEEVAREIAADGGRARPLPFDVTRSDAVRDAFMGLQRLDILVNNAGLSRPPPFLEVDKPTLDLLLGLNVIAAFVVAQAAARLMVANGGGVIVNVSSQVGPRRLRPEPHRLCDDQARGRGVDHGDGGRADAQGVRVVSIASAFVTTPLTKPFFEDPAFRNGCSTASGWGRIGTVEEVASAVVFLAPPAAALVTGSSLLIDGGLDRLVGLRRSPIRTEFSIFEFINNASAYMHSDDATACKYPTPPPW